MGSITIDQTLLAKVGILPLEVVEVTNLSNGKRWSTYVIPGDSNKGEICPNGGGALLCETGDILIIYAIADLNLVDVKRNGHQALILFADENNKCQTMLRQTVQFIGDRSKFNSSEIIQD
jgi:Aspartate 1-decarboxylase